MKNIDHLKSWLVRRVDDMTPEMLYKFMLQPEPFISSLCRYCRTEFGDCPDSLEDDSICMERFKTWCEMENVTLLKQNEPER